MSEHYEEGENYREFLKFSCGEKVGAFPGSFLSSRVPLESFRFEDEDEDKDEDEALCFRHNEIFKLFRLQLGRDDEVDCNNIVTPSLSRI